MLQETIGNNIGALLTSEMKFDVSVTSSPFMFEGFTPSYKLGRRLYGGGIMLFLKEDIP